MVQQSKRAPMTFGELRKLLAEMGNPWQPDPNRSDGESLPEYPTGGDGTRAPSHMVIPVGGVINSLKRHPPMNPDLQVLWREEGLLDEPAQTHAPAGPKQSRQKKTTPAPNTGG